jgi:choice-of-anchor C domain-containing protein
MVPKMRRNWPLWLRKWISFALRVGQKWTARKSSHSFLSVQHLEDRVVPARFDGGVSVAFGDFDSDGKADVVTGLGGGESPKVRVTTQSNYAEIVDYAPYSMGFRGGSTVATGDVNGDGVIDLITGAGPGGGPHVRVVSGANGTELMSYFAYAQSFSGGITVASSDVNGDGFADVITGAGAGGGPHVRIVSGKDSRDLGSFMAFEREFRGSVTVASADLDQDGAADIVVGAGGGGTPTVKIFSGRTLTELRAFTAYSPVFRGGVTVALGDVTGDGRVDIVTGAGAGGGPHVKVFDGESFEVVHSLFGYAEEFRGGVWVGAADTNNDGRAEVATGAGSGGGPHVRVWNPQTMTQSMNWMAFRPEAGFQPAHLVPGKAGTTTTVILNLDGGDSNFSSEYGIYSVDNANGDVDGLKPGDTGYAVAALAGTRRSVVYDGTATSPPKTEVPLAAGSYFGFYMIQNATYAKVNSSATNHPLYFSFPQGNSDAYDHSFRLPGTKIQFEDMTGGGDEDFNDFVASIRFRFLGGTVVNPVPPIVSPPVVPPILPPSVPPVVPPTIPPPPVPPVVPPTIPPPPPPPVPPVVPPVVPPPPMQFSFDLFGWTVAESGGSAGNRGSVIGTTEGAVLREGNSFQTTLSRSFLMPSAPSVLSFAFSSQQFDQTDNGFVRDAFEVALLDDRGRPLVDSITSGRDAYFNQTEGNTAAVRGKGVTTQGETVTVDLSSVAAGTVATLVFRLINNDRDTGSTVTVRSVGLPSTDATIAPVKFFVVDPSTDTTYRYATEGLTAGQIELGQAVGNARGVASNPAGDTLWVVDATTKQVNIFDAVGNLQGSWIATDVTDPVGITVHNGDLWLVDSATKLIHRYDGGAQRRAGFSSATSSFALANENLNPSDLVTDGATFWVSDDVTAKVFVYDLTGSQLGSWLLDGDNTSPSGVTIDPSGGSDLWIVDRSTRRVYRYANGRAVRSGTAISNNTFQLDSRNINPEGIADPPPRAGLATFTNREDFLSVTNSSNATGQLPDVGLLNGEGNATFAIGELTFSLGTPSNQLYFGTAGMARPPVANDWTLLLPGPDIAISGPENLVVDLATPVYSLGFDFVEPSNLENLNGGVLNTSYIHSEFTATLKRGGWTVGVFKFDVPPDTAAFVGVSSPEPFDRVEIVETFGAETTGGKFGGDQFFGQFYTGESRATLQLPTIDVESPNGVISAGDHALLRGTTTVDNSQVPNRILNVTIDGRPVDLLDESGRFWVDYTVRPGQNSLNFVATDTYGQTATTTLVIEGRQGAVGEIDFSQLTDLTSNFVGEYSRTSFDTDSKTLFADVAVRNLGQYPANVPLFVGVKNISDPSVQVLQAAGTLPDGTPYYDFTGLVTADTTRLEPNATTGTLSLTFANPNRGRFTYDLVFLGALNRGPTITSLPKLEASIGRTYRYAATAVDPDQDALLYSLASAPSGMTISSTTGLISWMPVTDQKANHEITLVVSDGRGGRATQNFTVVADLAPPNRPPVFTSIPVVEAAVGEAYSYFAVATDADDDVLTYALAGTVLAGMQINPATGQLTWTPAVDQRGDQSVTIRVTDGNGGWASQTYSICVKNDRNRAPVIVSEPVTTATIGAPQSITGRVVLAHDVNPLSVSLATANEAKFAVNVARWITAGNSGRLLAVDSNPLDTRAKYSQLVIDAIAAAGFTTDVTNRINYTTEELSEYDGIFVGQLGPSGAVFDNQILVDYIRNGGGVYLYSGVLDGRPNEEVIAWEDFLSPIGLAYGDGGTSRYNEFYGSIPVSSSHPIFSGISELRAANGVSLRDTESDNPLNQVLITYQGEGVYAVYDGQLSENLLINGSFEANSIAQPEAFIDLLEGSAEITGWVVTTGGIDYTSSGYWQTAEGIWSVDLNGFVPGGIAQTFATTPGAKYEVTYDLTGNPGRPFGEPPDEYRMRVSAAGADELVAYPFAGQSFEAMGWGPRRWEFTAVSAMTTLEFRSLTEGPDPRVGPVLDNVSVRKASENQSTYRYQVASLDGNDDQLSYSLPVAPTGMTINSATGFIRWSPQPASLGNELIQNGSFESLNSGLVSLVGGSGGYNGIPTGNTGIDNWIVTNDDIDLVYSYWRASNGTNSLDLGGSYGNGAISQTIATLPGNKYRVEFDLAGHPGLLPVVKTLRVRAGDQSQEYTFDTTGKTLFDLGWQRRTFEFVAQSTSTLLTIESADIAVQYPPGIAGPTLDNVSVREVIESVRVPVTVRVEDGRGGFDEQSFIVTPKASNEIVREFDPVVEWHQDTFSVLPDHKQVIMTPAVIDMNADGTPDVVFVATPNTVGFSTPNGVLRTISGKDGTELWTVSDPNYQLTDFSGIAIGDIDRDGKPEVVAIDGTGKLVAFENDGTPKWRTTFVIPGNLAFGDVGIGSPAIADLDADGVPEIVFGATVVNADGTLRWDGSGITGTGRADNAGFGPLSAVADLTGDGILEVLAGKTAFRADGSLLWTAAVPDGFPAVGNFDADSGPEIVLVAGGAVYLLDADGTVIWGPRAIPGGGEGGPPTIADFDNDGRPEIGVAGATRYIVFETDGSVRWQSPTQDGSSRVTGSSVFDFDGDGSAEAVYGDELFLRIYRGSDGTVLFSLPKSSATGYEYPVIADVDGDGNAEIVAVANSTAGFGPQTGIYVIGDRNSTWVSTRKIWNQHTYHVTNINDDGTIPRTEANSWELYNSYRTNVLTEGFDPRLAPDLVVSSSSQGTGSNGATFTATIKNMATAPVAAGAKVSFYDGDPLKGRTLIGSTISTTRLRKNETETVTIAATGLVNDLWILVDPLNAIAEFDESNNRLRAGIDTDAVNYAPQLYLTIANQSTDAGAIYRFTIPLHDPDGDAIAFDLISAPDGMAVHPTLGVIAWRPRVSEIGDHTVVVRATDAAGNVTLQPYILTVLAPNTAPVITSKPPTGPAVVGNPFQYVVRVQDAENDPLTYSLQGAPAGVSISATGRITWMPTANQVGSHQFIIVVKDSLGNEATQQVSFSVLASAVNQTPVFVGDIRSSAWTGQSFQDQFRAFDADGDPLTYHLVTPLSGATLDPVTGLFTWLTPTSTSFEVEVSDGRGGVAARQVTLELLTQEINRAPRVVSNPPATATVGIDFAYDLVATDADGDRVRWRLVSAPRGVSLDAEMGTLRWRPTEDQTGSASFVVEAIDSLLATGRQSFTVSVSCINQGPSITSTPPTIAYVNDPYFYAVRGVDPENDDLTYSLDSAPIGMTINAGTGLTRWIPTAAQAGPQDVIVRVSDGVKSSTQSFRIVVSTESPNRAPVITSTPRVRATPGLPYEYFVTANDLDGDAIRYELNNTDSAFSIDQTTGRISWLPTQAGFFTVQVSAIDARGATATQAFVVEAKANAAPAISAINDATVTVGGTFRTTVRATDADFDTLTYRLESSPAGMSIDQRGFITWKPTDYTVRTESVTVIVTDPAGASASRSFNVVVTPDAVAPRVNIVQSTNVLDVGQSVTIWVQATDNVAVSSISLKANGQPVALDASGRATITYPTPQLVTLTATASDPAGNVGQATANLRVIDPSDTVGPDVTITRLVQLNRGGSADLDISTGSATISYLADLYGTIDDPANQLESWKVLFALADAVDTANLNDADPAWKVIASGTTEITNGKLATIDPTVLENNGYVVLITAYDTNGRGTLRGLYVNVTGEAKLGEFKLAFTDLSLLLNGIPVQVTRGYNTRNATSEGDFGYGWNLLGANADIRETVPGGNAFVPNRTRVYLTKPDGSRVGFTFQPTNLQGSFLGTIGTPAYKADPGVQDRLESDGAYAVGGILGAFVGYNPDDYRLITPEGLTYFYNQTAGLQKITDRNGNTVTFTRDGIRHSGGQEVTFTRDGAGRITQITSPDGASVKYSYDAGGNLVAVTNQVNETTTLKYRSTPAHFLDEIYDSKNRRILKAEFDASGRLTGTTDALGNSASQSFDTTGFTGTQRDARGSVTLLTYNERGNVLSKTDPEGGVTQYSYDDAANPDKETKVINPRGVVTLNAYDPRGNLISVTTPDGTTTTTYTADNKLASVTDVLGRVTSYAYSPTGNLLRVINALGSTSVLGYDELGRVTSYTDFAGNRTLFSDFCGCGRPKQITNPDGSIRRVEYHNGLVTKITDELGNVTQNEYDASGRLLRTIDGEGHVTAYEYDGQNQTKITDPNGNITRYEYDAAGNRTKITDAEGGITLFSYDANGNMASLTDPVGNVTRFVYNKNNQVSQEIDPLGNARQYEFDAAGNQIAAIDRNGRRRTFEYDPMNRQTLEKWFDSSTLVREIASTYDRAGNLMETSDPAARLIYSYDALNRVKTARTEFPGSNIAPVTLTNSYDANGNRIRVIDNFGVSVDSTYDNRNRLDIRTWQGGVDAVRVDYDYRANGERQTLTRYADAAGTNKIGQTSYEFYRNGLTKGITHTGPTGNVLVDYDYFYDAGGRLQSETHHDKNYVYGYDKTNQLTRVDIDGALAESFSYDKNGNRITSTGFTPGNYTTGPGNQLLSDGTFRYTYDREGNLKTKTSIADGSVTEYSWDYRNRLVGVEERSAGGIVMKTVQYAYDPAGRRIAEVVNGVATLRVIHDGDHAWADFGTNGAISERYLFGNRTDEIMARSSLNKDAVWHLVDRLSTIRNLVGSIGEPVNTINYSAFGQILLRSNLAVSDRFAYTGRELDYSDNSYNYRSRYYDPALARFLTLDPFSFMANDTNLYRYVGNSSLNATDPSGNLAIIEFVALTYTAYSLVRLSYDISTGQLPTCNQLNNPADYIDFATDIFGYFISCFASVVGNAVNGLSTNLSGPLSGRR